MNRKLTEDQTFDKINFTLNPLTKGEYEYCTFKDCDFSNSDLGDILFMECTFEGCNLSMAKLSQTVFRDIKFRQCKMLGLHFEHCNEFGFSVHFDDCRLDHSSFYKTKMKKTLFKNLNLLEVDFSECDVSSSVFDHCDFSKATFENTILEKTDFSTSYNYSIDPERNRIKKARFSATGVVGLLDKYDIHIE